MNENLYPELTDEGQKQAQKLVDNFNKTIEQSFKEAAEKATSKFYTEVLPFIESDAWQNYRSQILMGMSNYSELGKHEAKKIRESIIQNHWDELKGDIEQDLVEENERLRRDLHEAKLRL